MEYAAKRNPDRCPTHPGAVLREALEAMPLSKVEAAEALGISRQHLYDLINERKPISAQVAVRIGKLLGNGPGIWLRMQTTYDLWHAEREVA
jgi:addiction module HigA family antidote